MKMIKYLPLFLVLVFTACGGGAQKSYEKKGDILVVANKDNGRWRDWREYSIKYKVTRKLISELYDIKGIKKAYAWGEYTVGIVKIPAYTWEEIEPSVLKILEGHKRVTILGFTKLDRKIINEMAMYKL